MAYPPQTLLTSALLIFYSTQGRAISSSFLQKCEQAGQRSQGQCSSATKKANGGDDSQANLIHKATVDSPTGEQGAAKFLMAQSSGQMGRLLSADSACQDARDACEKECDDQKKQAASQQGDTAEIDKAKQQSCTEAIADMTGPLLNALSQATQAFQKANDSSKQSGTSGMQVASLSPPTPGMPSTVAVPTKTVDAGVVTALTSPAGRKTVSALLDSGGKIGGMGIQMPDGSMKTWSSFSSGSGGGGIAESAARDLKKPDATAVAAQTARSSARNGAQVEGIPAGAAPEESEGVSDLSSMFENPRRGRDDPSRNPAEFSKYLGRSIIGVPGDNLFSMVHRAYEKRMRLNEFVGYTNGTTSRAP